MKENILIIGGGGHAKVIISILKRNDAYNIIGYTDKINKGTLLGIKYLGTDTVLSKFYKENICRKAILGVGQVLNNNFRQKVIKNILEIGFNFPAIISNTAIVNEDVEIGNGTVVFDGAIINTGTKIGKYSIINTGAIIEHDCQISDFTHIAPGAVLSGGVKVKKNTMIGAGATVIQNIKIGGNIIIGAGAVVIKDCNKKGIYAGVPSVKIDKK